VTFTTRPELSGSFGMVASTHWLASGAGMSVLERGGNAFDAAVAAGFVLQVVEPHLNGPGGDLPVVAWSASRGEPFVVCGQGVSPAKADAALLRDSLGLDVVPGTGLLPACVPGAFDGWLLMLLEHGTWRLADVLEYAIGYAATGFPALARIADTIAGAADLFREEWASSAEQWLPAPEAGAWMRNEPLAETYRRIVREASAATGDRDGQIQHARDQWLRGWVAEAVVGFMGTEVLDASGRRHTGLLTEADLADWSASFETPATYDYRGVTVCKTGPWGQGPVLLQQLALLSGMELGSGADWVHRIVEASKLCFADREAFYGSSGAPAPLGELLSDGYAASRRGLIGESASMDFTPGLEGRLPRVVADEYDAAAAGPRRFDRRGAGVGEPTMGDTCHLDVVDREGNLVSATPSGGWLQSSPTVPGLGFCLGTRGQMFWLEEGLPSSQAGGVRPRTTLSPSLALRDGEGWMAFGTPGGDQQDQWSLQLFLNVMERGMNLQEAIDAPAFMSDHFPSSFYPRHADPGRLEVEARWGDAVIASLRERGHDVEVTGAWSQGRLSAVTRENGVLRAAANPRGMQGYAVGR
jgi:gamma-glutamyltranspeptidase/glutathione hydrolase